MAKVARTFRMSTAPDAAQEMFLRSVAPVLYKVGGFSVVRPEKPGRLEFSDGIVKGIGISGDERLYTAWRRRLSRKITVAFSADPSGTLVEIRGHAERDLCDALNNLGDRGRWPATAE